MVEAVGSATPPGAFVPPVPDVSSSHAWQIENLIKASLRRTKERFLSYFLALIVSLLLGAAAFLAVIIVGFFLGLIGGLTKSVVLVAVIGLPLLALLILAGIYLGVWIQLVLVDVLTQKERVGVMGTFGKIRPYVWGYYIYSLLFNLFFFGLLLWGILSFGIILILWSLWSSFSVFVYLEKRKKNLANLWYSRALINQRFWGIVGRLVLVAVAFYLVIFLKDKPMRIAFVLQKSYAYVKPFCTLGISCPAFVSTLK